ncbi:Membrane-associated, eicosanoid/glutathione metabolism (MAPEG) protein [Plasmopara halstedii]|uniref:Microsomal glutathione S-transferase 1 n=1 Tax=Plasmopara halstedii TaxID=4781 RepID=A0A0N7L6D9_PLAHL|nr:Membrane-associated, eicosanoid/glutathione metabolism (MAPEG) protein [Plasmopara halstedii]CEG44003.1 Membrane-associated, eicosanoid/glutathione metabolism (MAPEG) protein [Plasmopara halstedii]|eukprot:XP_024580372.1 Membrane-associated, eicosanoid/glutathione metabolism (MAPEG) protein [Plasmopara halstedii]
MVLGTIKVYVACTSVLYVKFLAATTIQGAKKFVTGGRPPEDTKFSSAKRKQTFGFDKTSDTESLEAAQRWKSIVMNDLESIPIGLLIFGAGIMAGADPVIHYRAMIAFTVARCLHTYAYATAMQPLRSLSHGVSVTATLVGLGNAVSAIF